MEVTIGRLVYYAPPQDCKGKTTLDYYASLVTQVNSDGTIELATFGPNSLYFQHGVKHSDDLQPGCWSWMPYQKQQQEKK